MKVAIVITGLSTGGAEIMLLKLLERIDRSRFSVHVFSLTTLGDIGPRISAIGIPVEAMNMPRGRFGPVGLFRLIRRLRQLRAHIVHTWMYHADLLGGVAARAAGIRTVVWGIRNSTLQPGETSTATRLVVRVNAVLSRWIPAGIVSCSTMAREVHIAAGYDANKIVVIPNGFDLGKFRPDPAARASVRAELSVPMDAPLVGIVGRYDPQKNHVGFLQAAGLLRSMNPHVHFVLIGAGVDHDNATLLEAAADAGVGAAAHFLGRRDDIPRLMASMDVLASASTFGEAFPNVIGEAMACGVPCVVTDVGDSALIIGDCGCVIEPRDTSAFAAAIAQLLSLAVSDRAALGGRARVRVKRYFDLHDVVERYEQYYMKLTEAEG